MTPSLTTSWRQARFRRLAAAPLVWLMPASAIAIGLFAAAGAIIAAGWPLVHDAPLMHYVVFLMDHGRAPYRDMIEMNMPGTYITEWLVVHGLGGGALSWWLWDLLLGLAAIAASAWIGGQGRRAAGAAAGAFVYLTHLRDGAWNLGERDWEVAVLLLAAVGCLFEAIRKDRPVWMAGFMAACATAASIKPPTALIGLVLLLAVLWLKRPGQGAGQPKAQLKDYVLWSFIGGLAPTAAVAIFLWRWGVTQDFLATVHGLAPWYASLKRVSALGLLARLPACPILLVGAAAVYGLRGGWRDWGSNILLGSTVAGAVLFMIQGKGWSYHRYPELAFAALWGMLELDRGLREGRAARVIAAACLVVTVAVMSPRMLIFERANQYPMRTMTHLQSDLASLGGARLSGAVQCLDVTLGGCINVLYRLRLLQVTGFISDFYLFPDGNNPVTGPLQTRFLREMDQKRPKVVVLTSHTWPKDIESYDQLASWPAFAALLARDYRLDRELPIQGDSAGYRIYVLKEGGR